MVEPKFKIGDIVKGIWNPQPDINDVFIGKILFIRDNGDGKWMYSLEGHASGIREENVELFL